MNFSRAQRLGTSLSHILEVFEGLNDRVAEYERKVDPRVKDEL